MSVWFAIPSKRQAPEAQIVFDKWASLGFLTAAFRDSGDTRITVDLLEFGEYTGYGSAVNLLCKQIMLEDKSASIIVTAGDDYLPDPKINLREEEQRFLKHFSGSFGVMQPTGDRWMVDKETGTCASERVCDAPWMGREFCELMYAGKGPLCEEYFHFFVDEELHNVASMQGVLWHRPDIYQYHEHWLRSTRKRPEFLSAAKMDWNKAKELFNARKAAGFPGHHPLRKETSIAIPVKP